MLCRQLFKSRFVLEQSLMQFKGKIAVLHTDHRIGDLIEIEFLGQELLFHLRVKDTRLKLIQPFPFGGEITQI